MNTKVEDRASRKGDRVMSRVKVCNNQLTLPEEARVKLGVADDGYLDVEVVEGGVLLRSVADAERRQAGEGDAARACSGSSSIARSW
jgi:hypothetical protein